MRLKSLVIALCALYVGQCLGADSVLCHNGAYRTRSGDLLVIAGGEKSLRYFLPDGRSGWLRSEAEGSVRPVPGWDTEAPAQGTAQLGACHASSVDFSLHDGAARQWDHIPLQVTDVDFQSGEVRLRGRLVTPAGRQRWPLVVLVHGAEKYSAVDAYSWQYLLPSQGVAVFIFDKRGTGHSTGAYTQNFSLLADDVVAAMTEARRLAGTHAERVGLFAGSQGGWVAPQAAVRAHADFLAVGFGLLLTPLGEDRAQVLRDLRFQGFDDEKVLAAAAQVADATAQIVRSGFTQGYRQLEALKRRYGHEPWFSELRGEYTGELLQASEKELRRNGKAKYDNLGVPWEYDSVASVTALQVPQIWMLGGEDSEAPSSETLAILRRLQAEGKNIDVVVFPRANHGIIEFKVMPDGTRIPTQYSKGFFDLPADWIHGRAIGRRYGDAMITLHEIR